jgi:hypothetical protein
MRHLEQVQCHVTGALARVNFAGIVARDRADSLFVYSECANSIVLRVCHKQSVIVRAEGEAARHVELGKGRRAVNMANAARRASSRGDVPVVQRHGANRVG